MSGFATPLINNVAPAHFAQVSQNMANQLNMAAQSHAQLTAQQLAQRRARAVMGDRLKAEEDRDADGHAWGPPRRRRRQPGSNDLSRLAGEGAVVDRQA